MHKILMVTSFYPPYHVGGACTHVYYLANELARLGHEVHVLFSMDAYFLKRNGRPKKNYVNHKNVKLHPITTPIGRLTPLLTYITGMIPYKQQLDVFDQEFDVIHYHNVSLFGPEIFKFGKGKKIYTAHDHWLVCPYNDMFNGKSVCLQPANCNLCLAKNKRPPQLWRNGGIDMSMIDQIIAPSKYISGFLKQYNIKNGIVIIPNFVPDPPSDMQIIPEDDFFLYAGMLEDIKGIKQLIEAFKIAKQKLIIAGSGSLKSYVQAKQDDRIKYVGFLGKNELYAYYQRAKAFVLASTCPENSPLTMLEAMSVGTPAIGRRIGGIPEIVEKIDAKLCFSDTSELPNMIKIFTPVKKDIRAVFQKNYSRESYIKKYLDTISK